MANDEYDNAITDKEMAARFAHLRDLSVAAEPVRDDIANAVTILQLNIHSNGNGTLAIPIAEFDAAMRRLRSALAKLDAGAAKLDGDAR